MAKKQTIGELEKQIAALERLAAANSGATEGERKAAQEGRRRKLITLDKLRREQGAAKAQQSAPITLVEYPVFVKANPVNGEGRWKNLLLDTVCAAFGCKFYLRPKMAANAVIVAPTVQIATEVWRIFTAIESPRGTAFTAYCAALRAQMGPNVNVNGHDSPWGDSFLLGYCESVAVLFGPAIERNRQSVLDISARYPQTNDPKPTAKYTLDERAYNAGKAWGARLTADDFLTSAQRKAKAAAEKAAKKKTA